MTGQTVCSVVEQNLIQLNSSIQRELLLEFKLVYLDFLNDAQALFMIEVVCVISVHFTVQNIYRFGR